VAQQTCARIVGERQAGIEERPDYRFPIVEHLPAEFAQFREGTVLVEFAQNLELARPSLLLGNSWEGPSRAAWIACIRPANRSRRC
jgi:hypothetical protein